MPQVPLLFFETLRNLYPYLLTSKCRYLIQLIHNPSKFRYRTIYLFTAIHLNYLNHTRKVQQVSIVLNLTRNLGPWISVESNTVDLCHYLVADSAIDKCYFVNYNNKGAKPNSWCSPASVCQLPHSLHTYLCLTTIGPSVATILYQIYLIRCQKNLKIRVSNCLPKIYLNDVHVSSSSKQEECCVIYLSTRLF